MIKAMLILLILSSLSGPPLAYAPTCDFYRMQVLEDRIIRLQALELWAIRNGVHVDLEGRVWR